MREAFENYQLNNSYRDYNDLSRMPNGDYWQLEVQWEWKLWQSAWESGNNDTN